MATDSFDITVPVTLRVPVAVTLNVRIRGHAIDSLLADDYELDAELVSTDVAEVIGVQRVEMISVSEAEDAIGEDPDAFEQAIKDAWSEIQAGIKRHTLPDEEDA